MSFTRTLKIAAVRDWHVREASGSLFEPRVERALRWYGGKAGCLRLALAGIRTEPRFVDAFTDIETETGCATSGVRVDGSGTHRRWRFEGELLSPPADFESSCRSATTVRLVFGEALGGSSDAADQMLATLDALPPGRLVGAHVEKVVASAHAALFCLAPCRRTMAAGATITLHSAVSAVVGDAGRLRDEAARLERLEVDFIRRLARRTGQPLRTVARWVRDGRDTTFSAEGALAVGLCDAISPE